MFKNGKSTSQTPPADVTVINRGTTVEGEVKVAGTIRIYGRLNGTVHSEGKVIVAEDGVLSGDIYAETADVSGRVEGVIEAGRLDLRSTASVEGKVIVKKFTTETGAIFIGDCKMPQNGTLPSKKAPATSEENAAEGAQDAAAEATDDGGNPPENGQRAETSNGKSSSSKKKSAKTTAPSVVEGGVKPIPNKSDDTEPQAETADVSASDDDSNRPRFW